MASSIFLYTITLSVPKIALKIYETLTSVPDDDISCFNLQLLSENELSGEYITIKTIEETFYNATDRSLEKRQVQKASVVSFNIFSNYLEIWGSKINSNRLLFAISVAFQNKISINAVEVSIGNILRKLHNYKIKVSKVYFEDFLFTEDIVGNFTVDLSSYGDSFAVINKYKEKIAKITIIIPYNGMGLKTSISAKGIIMVYKPRDFFDDNVLVTLHNILLNEV